MRGSIHRSHACRVWTSLLSLPFSALVDGKTPVSLEGVDVLRAGGMGQGVSNGATEGFANFLSGRSVYLSTAALSAAGRKGRRCDYAQCERSRDPGSHRRQPSFERKPERGDDGYRRRPVAIRHARPSQPHGHPARARRPASPGPCARSARYCHPTPSWRISPAKRRATTELSAAYRVNLDMLALIALLTGGFLVYSAQSLSVARRRAQFALLRVLGMRRKKVLGQVLTEAMVLGVIGAGSGVVLGLGLASLALNLLGGDLGGGYFHRQCAATRLRALGGGDLRVARHRRGGTRQHGSRPGGLAHPPGPGDQERWRRRRSTRSCASMASGRMLWRERSWRRSLLPSVAGIALFGYVAMALLLAGGVMLVPWLARALVSPLRHVPLRNVPFRLATARLWGAPSQASVALAGIVASTALTVAMAVMVTSFRGSVERWLGDVLQADVYLLADGGSGGFDAATLERMRRVPGVAWLGVLKETPLQFDARRPAVTLLARTLTGPGGHLALMGPRVTVPAGAIPVWVSEPASRIYHWKPGDTLTLPLPASPQATVAGVWRDYARQAWCDRHG